MAIDVDLLTAAVSKITGAEEEEKEPVETTKVVYEKELDKNYKVIELDLNTTYNNVPLLLTNGLIGKTVKKLDIIRCDISEIYVRLNSPFADQIPLSVGGYIHDFVINEIYLTTKETAADGKLIILLRW